MGLNYMNIQVDNFSNYNNKKHEGITRNIINWAESGKYEHFNNK